MEDLHAILDVIAHSEQKLMVLATVIRVEGSAYKKAGSSMLILEEKRRVGLLSAGCLEADLTERAKQVWESGEAVTVQYDMSAEDDLSWGQGAGCNGIITVFLEPVKGKLFENLIQLKNCLDDRRCVVRIKRFTRKLQQVDDVFLVEDGTSFGRGELYSSEETYTFTHRIVPKPHLYVFGAGEDARPLVSLAARVGFLVTVVDWREALCKQEFFTQAHQRLLGNPEEMIARIPFSTKDYAVIMTHHFQKDKLILSELKNKPLFYLGILGPRKRTERLLDGASVPGSIHSPVGLSIGAEGHEEIAVSIVAELIEKMRNDK